MKTILLPVLLIASCPCFSQDTSRLMLFQPGTELVYQVYTVKPLAIGGRSYFHTTQMVYTVTDVKYDSVSDTYFSHITKRGIPSDEFDFKGWQSYQTLIRKDNVIKLPLELYNCDTVFYKGGKHPTIIGVVHVEEGSINYPLINDDRIKLQLPTYTVNMVLWRSEQNRYGPSTSFQDNQEGTVDLVSRKIVGQETIETPAGKFNCFKIDVVANFKLTGWFGGKAEYIEYFSPQYGIVKTEPVSKMGYYELIRIKKPG